MNAHTDARRTRSRFSDGRVLVLNNPRARVGADLPAVLQHPGVVLETRQAGAHTPPVFSSTLALLGDTLGDFSETRRRLSLKVDQGAPCREGDVEGAVAGDHLGGGSLRTSTQTEIGAQLAGNLQVECSDRRAAEEE